MGERLAFLGMGTMGGPMARNLLKAGHAVTVYNRTRARAEALRADGAEVAGTPAEATRAADVILACLFDAAAVEQVLSGPGGVLEAIGPGQVFVDHTTNSPPVSQRLAALLGRRGAAMLDAPVSGGDVGAIQGTLSIMCGGPPEVFERCRPVLEAMGRRITLMGPQVGAGGYAKLANQIMVAAHLVAMGEALVFGAKAGLHLDRLVAALGGGMANSAVLELKADKLLRRDFEPGAEVNVHLKDLTYIRQAMDALGISLPLAKLLRELFQQAVDAGLGAEDHSAVVRLFERAAGVEVHR
jgi:3-hydroxyisobutyrate dehydrogenase-like beta-hydroxyacid dehydrogenase